MDELQKPVFNDDHAKTAIGTLLATGTVIGTGANVFGDVRPPKFVRPFSWGASAETRVEREGFLLTAGRVLERRNVPATDQVRHMLENIYEHAVNQA